MGTTSGVGSSGTVATTLGTAVVAGVAVSAIKCRDEKSGGTDSTWVSSDGIFSIGLKSSWHDGCGGWYRWYAAEATLFFLGASMSSYGCQTSFRVLIERQTVSAGILLTVVEK